MAVKKAKPKKALLKDEVKPKKKKKVKEKNTVKNVQTKKPPIRAGDIAKIVSGTLKRHSMGEYKLPGMLTRHLTGPKAKLGLHFEYYISEVHPPLYFDPEDREVEGLFLDQAWRVVSELSVNQYPIKEKEMKPHFCKEHDD